MHQVLELLRFDDPDQLALQLDAIGEPPALDVYLKHGLLHRAPERTGQGHRPDHFRDLLERPDDLRACVFRDVLEIDLVTNGVAHVAAGKRSPPGSTEDTSAKSRKRVAISRPP